MSILLRQATIVDPTSPFHLQKLDILIKNGIIDSIVSKIDAMADDVVEYENLHVSQGWVDIFADFSDPGYEYRETLESGSNAAAAGAYTDVFVIPNTSPVIHNKAGIEYIIQRSRDYIVQFHPIAAITKDTEGKELAEMYDMGLSGAVAYSDGLNSVQSPGVLLKALQYVYATGKTIIQVPNDKTIHPTGLMNEGVVSTRLGLPGRPNIAEEIMVARDIELLRYTGSKLHISGISTAKSVDLIASAKKEGLNITCSVTPYHLYFTDEDLASYDTNLKLNPPLRSKSDRNALIDAVMNGIVDCISTHHLPQDTDHKMVEFEYAKHGMIGLQTSFALTRLALPELPLDQLVNLFSTNPRKIFNLNSFSINKGQKAVLSLFAPGESFTFTNADNKSKSNNSPVFNLQMKGKPLGIINKEKLFLN